jgi:diguanylate cyclase (GGDEF)-like protein
MGQEMSQIDREMARAAREAGFGGVEGSRMALLGATSRRRRKAVVSLGSGDDALPSVAATLGSLLVTCSALTASYRQRIRELEDEVLRLSDVADRDHLTGLGNRRSFERTLANEWLRALRSGSHLTLALVDVDHFKRFNDAYGHPRGDRVLHRVAQCLSGTLGRAADSVFRIGGEEFALVLPDTDQAGAGLIGERVCSAVRSAGIAHRDSPVGVVTMSFGSCSAVVRDGDRSDELLSLADQALYRAKREGRDRAHASRRKPLALRSVTAGLEVGLR